MIGPDADTRVQGGLLSDGVNSFLAALTTSPNTTYRRTWRHRDHPLRAPLAVLALLGSPV